MAKILKGLAKVLVLVLVLAVAGCLVFYLNRKEHFYTVNDFVEELLATLAELPLVALLIP